MFNKPLEKPIMPLVWVRILQNIINVLRKASVFDVRKLIDLHSKAVTDPEAVLDELIKMLKRGEDRRTVANNFKERIF